MAPFFIPFASVAFSEEEEKGSRGALSYFFPRVCVRVCVLHRGAHCATIFDWLCQSPFIRTLSLSLSLFKILSRRKSRKFSLWLVHMPLWFSPLHRLGSLWVHSRNKCKEGSKPFKLFRFKSNRGKYTHIVSLSETQRQSSNVNYQRWAWQVQIMPLPCSR